ncbi:MAG: hypothetical protein WBE13_07900 [Candidatus Acidiferrum sp.]
MILTLQKPLSIPRTKLERLPLRKRVTFISAFRCNEGIVLGADSQETYGDYKLTVDKLKPIHVGDYQVALGGCGIGDLVDSLCDHASEWVEDWHVESEREILHLLRPKVREFYQVEVSAYPGKQSDKRITALLCIKHTKCSSSFLFELRGSTVRKAPEFSLIGWDLPILQHFVRRLYKPSMPISQGVLLTLYLFSLVSSTVTVVGGETRILIARDNGIWIHDRLFVEKIQENIRIFTALIDKLVLSCPDTSLSTEQFESLMKEFMDTTRHIRKEYLHEMAHLALWNAVRNPEFGGDSYGVIPLGTSISYPNGEVTEATKEERQKLKEDIEWAEKKKQEMSQKQPKPSASGKSEPGR